MLNRAIEAALLSSTKHQALLEVMRYAVLPAGKLFRPRLVEALAMDLTKSLKQDHLHLAASIELHHAYTLIHDDLPSMDNDLVRRGKPSTHAQYGEWKAILAGDALLISSFEELGKITHPNLRNVFKLFSWATGAKGLISGQFLDLEADGKFTFKDVLRVHELKTGRLIQVATLGTYLLSSSKASLKEVKNFLRIGREIGVCFQLMDDLSELTVNEISQREREINPFFSSPAEILQELKTSHEKLGALLNHYQLEKTSAMLLDYFKTNQKLWTNHLPEIEIHLGKNEELKKWITTYV